MEKHEKVLDLYGACIDSLTVLQVKHSKVNGKEQSDRISKKFSEFNSRLKELYEDVEQVLVTQDEDSLADDTVEGLSKLKSDLEKYIDNLE